MLYAKNYVDFEHGNMIYFDKGEQFGLEKCAKVTFKQVSLVRSKTITLDIY